MKIKATTLLLLASMLLASCSQGSTTSDTEAITADTTTAETTAAETEPEVITDEVPELDFGGKSFRSMQQTITRYGFYASEENGDQVNDAIYARIASVEERLNVTMEETIIDDYTVVSDRIKSTVLAGDDAFELSLGQMYRSGENAIQGIYYNINDLPHINTEKPWYTKSVKEATIGDKLYMVASDLTLGYTQQTWMMMYNKTKAADYQLPDLYALVEDGKWTLDKIYELTANVYSDTNGDGARNQSDFYGLAGLTGGCLLGGFYYGAGAKMVTIDSDLKVIQNIADEHSINVLTKMAKLIVENNGSFLKEDNSAGRSTRKSFFPQGNILFSAMQVDDLTWDELRSMNDEYGILPLPKYDEAQEEYNTVVDGGADMVAIPASISDPEMVGAVIEILGALGYNEVLPAYINMALEVKGVRDEESVQMLRDVLASRVVDFGYMYDGNKGWTMKLPNIIRAMDTAKSYIDSNISAVSTYYTNALTALTAE